MATTPASTPPSIHDWMPKATAMARMSTCEREKRSAQAVE
jgi:hypothetical protein